MIQIADTEELRQRCFALRHAVFVEEQGVSPELEFDDIDNAESTIHLLLSEARNDIAVARVYPHGEGACHIGRIAVAYEYRGTGAGKKIVQAGIDIARENFARDGDGRREVIVELSAQEYAQGFYEKCGFVDTGEAHFEEAGIMHLAMRGVFRA